MGVKGMIMIKHDNPILVYFWRIGSTVSNMSARYMKTPCAAKPQKIKVKMLWLSSYSKEYRTLPSLSHYQLHPLSATNGREGWW